MWSLMSVLAKLFKLCSKQEKAEKKWQRGITPKILMPELQTWSRTLPLINSYMKFHFNSISRTRVIAKKRNVSGKAWQTGQTDRRSDGQTMEKWSLSVTSAYSMWHKKQLVFSKIDDLFSHILLMPLMSCELLKLWNRNRFLAGLHIIRSDVHFRNASVGKSTDPRICFLAVNGGSADSRIHITNTNGKINVCS